MAKNLYKASLNRESFGEPVLFIDMLLPATAIANEPCVVIKSVERENFLYILKEYRMYT